jgi:hypothetical protein
MDPNITASLSIEDAKRLPGFTKTVAARKTRQDKTAREET